MRLDKAIRKLFDGELDSAIRTDKDGNPLKLTLEGPVLMCRNKIPEGAWIRRDITRSDHESEWTPRYNPLSQERRKCLVLYKYPGLGREELPEGYTVKEILDEYGHAKVSALAEKTADGNGWMLIWMEGELL